MRSRSARSNLTAHTARGRSDVYPHFGAKRSGSAASIDPSRNSRVHSSGIGRDRAPSGLSDAADPRRNRFGMRHCGAVTPLCEAELSTAWYLPSARTVGRDRRQRPQFLGHGRFEPPRPVGRKAGGFLRRPLLPGMTLIGSWPRQVFRISFGSNSLALFRPYPCGLFSTRVSPIR
jgi:hypothetical protein